MLTGRRGAVAHVAVLLAATLILYGISLAANSVACWAILLLVAATAWPIWLYQREQSIFERRVVLAGLLHDTSRIRRWLWKGHVSSGVQVFAAIVWAALLLGLASLLDPIQWGVLAADAVVLGMLVPRVTRWMEREARPEQSGLVARRWMLAWINIGLLACAFFIVDFFVIGAADTRGRGWSEVADAAFLSAQNSAACSWAGAFVGALKAVDALAWHAAETIIPSLPNQGLKWIAWAAFLLQAGVIAVSFTRLQLGLATLLDRQPPRSATPAGPRSEAPIESPADAPADVLADTPTKSPTDASAEPRHVFLATIALVSIAGAALLHALRDVDARSLAALGRQLVAWSDPCRLDPNALLQLKTGVDQQLQAFRTIERDRAGRSADAALDALFADAEGAVESYLDWHFSVLGEYQRLGAVVVGNFAGSMSEQFETRVLGASFGDRLQHASGEIDKGFRVRVSETATRLTAQVKSGVESRACLAGRVDLPALASVERDVVRASASITSGAVVAVAAGLLARRAAAATATKFATKRAVQGGASAVAARAATKRAGSALAAAGTGAAVCGPLAPMCALLAGTGTWLLVDKVSISIDELRFRDDMRAELLTSLRAQKAELAAQLRALHEASIDRAVMDIDRSMQRVFVPVRQGL